MKVLKTIGLVLAGLIFLIVIISFFLPGSYHVERSTVINTDASIPFNMAKDFREWDKWSPWHKIDTTMVKTYSDIQGEVGSWYTWDSKNPDAGKGKITITKLTQNEFIENEMAFDGMGISMAAYKFEPVEGGIKVTWTLDGEGKGMPWYMMVPAKYFNLMMDRMVGKDYEKGLAKLKELSEAMPKAEQIEGFDIEERVMEPVKLAGIRETIKPAEVNGNTFGKWFGQITQVLQKQKLTPAGAPRTLYYEYGPKKVEAEAAIPVATLGSDEGNVKFHETAQARVLVIKYYGDYSKTEPVYMAAYDYIKAKGKSSNGAPMEIYITDPMMEKDTAKWLTELVFPLD
ncbi:MAG: SRPBCC family protein [Bacteroidota bacterium]